MYAIYGRRSYELAENKGDTDYYAIDLATRETFPALEGPLSPSLVQWAADPICRKGRRDAGPGALVRSLP